LINAALSVRSIGDKSLESRISDCTDIGLINLGRDCKSISHFANIQHGAAPVQIDVDFTVPGVNVRRVEGAAKPHALIQLQKILGSSTK
jgi:hypothetical protein